MKLPRPEHWHNNSLTVLLSMVLFGAGGVLSAVWAAIFINRGDYLTAIVVAGFAALAVGGVLAVALPWFGRVELRGTYDSAQTILRPDSVITALLIAVFVAAIPSGVLYVIFVPRGDINIPMSRGQQIFTPYLVAIGVLCAVGGLIALVVRRGPGCVRLTPHGFEIADILFTYGGNWVDIADITDEVPDKRKPSPIAILMKDGTSHVMQGAPSYTPGGCALYWMMRHYWLHPENREELIDGRALARLRSEQFPVE